MLGEFALLSCGKVIDNCDAIPFAKMVIHEVGETVMRILAPVLRIDREVRLL